MWQYDQDIDDDLRQIYDFLIRSGVNWFDTADSYGTGDLNGRSESLLGNFYSNGKGNRKLDVSFCTKLAPFPWRLTKKSMLDTFEGSRQRLGKPVDMVQLHWPPALPGQEQTHLNAFADIMASGEALQIGLSNYGPKGLRRVTSLLEKTGNKAYSNQVSNIDIVNM